MTVKRWTPIACLLTFLLISGVMVVFLARFMAGEPLYGAVMWQSAALVAADGSETPLELTDYEPPALEDGETLRFTAPLGELPENPCVIFETGDAEYVLSFNGEEIFRSVSALPQGALMQVQQARVALPQEGDGGTLELTFLPLAQWMWIYPPMLRITAPEQADRAAYAYANHYSISGAGFAVAFLLLLGLFLAQLTVGRRDWGGLCLAIASGLLAVYRFAVGMGYWFLPASLSVVLRWGGFHTIAVVCMVVYLVLDRRFWRLLAWATLCTVILVVAACLISLPFGGGMATYVLDILGQVSRGAYDNAVYWATAYLAAACSAAACYRAARGVLRIQADSRTLALKHDLAMESYRAMEENARRTAELRHELRNQITALRLMSEQGREEELRHALEELDRTHAQLTAVSFCKNFLFNAILQNIAARAAAEGIDFTATAILPEELPFGEQDLCAYLMNLLDNALEGSRTTPPGTQPFIRFHAQMKSGFLAIHCENSYGGVLQTDERGGLVTTKADREAHGFGLRQMEAVAKKYRSVLVVDHTPEVFSVQTALKLPETRN